MWHENSGLEKSLQKFQKRSEDLEYKYNLMKTEMEMLHQERWHCANNSVTRLKTSCVPAQKKWQRKMSSWEKI